MARRRDRYRLRPVLGAVGTAVILGATIFARVLHGTPVQDPAKAVSGDNAGPSGEDTVVKVCTECHEFDQVVALRRTPREWKDMVTTMANKGATGSPDEFAAIRQYLTRHYGLVAVNTAPAADLSAVLGLSQQDADGVVAYRSEHGKFANLEALTRVPGLDKSKLEDQADALRFD
jgi:competence ComEA-like helix-hairpin-helix protein